MLGMLPAQQCLGPEHDAAPQVDLGLEVQAQLLVVERLLHAAERQHALFGAPAVLRVEEEIAVAPRLFGAVHRMVGVAQQRVGVAVIDRKDGGTDAGGHGGRWRLRIEQVRLRDHAQHPFDGQSRFLDGVGTQQQHELVAAQARGHVRPGGMCAQRAAQPRRQFHQQAIACTAADGAR